MNLLHLTGKYSLHMPFGKFKKMIMSKVNFKIEKAVNGYILRSDICGVRVYEKKEDLCAFIASSFVNGIKFKDDIANISIEINEKTNKQ